MKECTLKECCQAAILEAKFLTEWRGLQGCSDFGVFLFEYLWYIHVVIVK